MPPGKEMPCLAPMVIWGSQYSSIFLLIYIVYFNCNMSGTNKVVVVVFIDILVINYLSRYVAVTKYSVMF